MSCWVVPSVAAELWGMAVGEVLNRIRTGSLSSKIEYGFTLVDVAPDSPKLMTMHSQPRPLTYKPAPGSVHEDAVEEENEEIEEGKLDWRATRAAMGMRRRGPGMKLAAA